MYSRHVLPLPPDASASAIPVHQHSEAIRTEPNTRSPWETLRDVLAQQRHDKAVLAYRYPLKSSPGLMFGYFLILS